MRNSLKNIFIALAFIPALMTAGAYADGYSLEELRSLKHEERDSDGDNNENDFRIKAMREAALAVGAQNGYIDHLDFLKEQILLKEDNLDDLYDFSMIMKLASGRIDEMHLLPPVIRKSQDIVSVSSDSYRIKIAGKMYQIIKPARLVSVAPNWRQYLIYDQKVSASKPSRVLLPKTSHEESMWSEWVEEGWQAGINQAEIEMTYRVRKLGLDFKGMVKYVQLLTEGKVLKPIVSSSHQNVVGGDNEMIVDEKILQLAMPARLNTNAGEWEPLILDTRGSLRQPIEKNTYEQQIK